jgi:hypothetical protein
MPRGPGRDDRWVTAGALIFSGSALMNLVGRNNLNNLDEIISAIGFSVAIPFFIIRLWSFETPVFKDEDLDAPEMLTVFALGLLAFATATVAFVWHMTHWAAIGMSIAMIVAMFLGTLFNKKYGRR